jgi:hypothetical protein
MNFGFSGSGPGGRRFKSSRPDHLPSYFHAVAVISKSRADSSFRPHRPIERLNLLPRVLQATLRLRLRFWENRFRPQVRGDSSPFARQLFSKLAPCGASTSWRSTRRSVLYICVYRRSLLYLTPNPQIGIKICSILGRPLSKKGKRK